MSLWLVLLFFLDVALGFMSRLCRIAVGLSCSPVVVVQWFNRADLEARTVALQIDGCKEGRKEGRKEEQSERSNTSP